MKKMACLFQREKVGNQYLAIPEYYPSSQWVADGEGIATRKWDGHCCLIEDGRIYKRHSIKPGGLPPQNWRAAQDSPSKLTGKWPGWVPVEQGLRDQWFRAAYKNWVLSGGGDDGTYELIGPKIQFNVEQADEHILIKHGSTVLPADTPRDFEGLQDYFKQHSIEGIVWHHPDGRMVKITGRDFGIYRN